MYYRWVFRGIMVMSFFWGLPFSQAYFGMGPLLPMLGNAFILIFVCGAAFFGVLAYPLKRLYDWFRTRFKKK